MAFSSAEETSACPETSKSSLPSPFTSTARIPLIAAEAEVFIVSDVPCRKVPSPFPRKDMTAGVWQGPPELQTR